MSAAEIARALKGHRSTGGWLCRCPAHNDKSPSLSIRDGAGGKLLVKCFAGCNPLDILRALRERGFSGQDAIRPPESDRHREEDIQRRAYGQRLWKEALPPAETPVQTYLRSRGYTGAIPPTLRHYPFLLHQRTGLRLHAMVAAVSVAPGREIVAIHRTYLKDDGSNKSPVDPNRMMLGSVKGGAVRLAPAAERMAVSEGIETGLSVQLATGIPTWAALSATGIENLILPHLPLGADIVIATDHDANGSGLRAAEVAARRWSSEGRKVSIAIPPIADTDFNDVLQEGVV